MYRPEPSSRHPLIVFLLILAGASGAGILFGRQAAPGSIEEQLPPLGVKLWGAALLIGAITMLVALALQASTRPVRFTNGVLFEQVGMMSFGVTGIVYSAAAFATVGWGGIFPVIVTFGFGVACIYRWASIQKGIVTARRAALERASEDGQL